MKKEDYRLTLEEFVENYVRPNTIIRLWTIVKGGHKMLGKYDDGSSVFMEHEFLKGKVWQYKYRDHKVLGVTDILVREFYPEAVNIVIEE